MPRAVPSHASGFGFGSSIHEQDVARWYACHTRSRAEKRVAQSLMAQTIESYVPTAMRKSVWADRTAVVSFPLFPGYVFARFELRDWHRILSIPGVATVVRQAGRPAPITDAEIENVRRFAAGLNRLRGEPEPQPFRDGQQVRVTSGPLEGVEGVVFLRRGRTSLLVGIRTIGQGIAVYVDQHLLQIVSSAIDR